MINKDKIMSAFKQNNAISVFKGTDGYAIAFDPWVGNMAPTDWTKVLQVYYEYSEEIGHENGKNIFDNSILELVNYPPLIV